MKLVRTGFVFNGHSRQYQVRNLLTPPQAYIVSSPTRDPGPDGVTGNTDDGTIFNLMGLDPTLIGQTLNSRVNVPSYHERTRSFEIAANRRFSDRWSLSASWAATWRNDFNAILYNPNGAPQSDYLRMTFVKVSGSYEPGWGIRLTPLLRYQSGTPFGRTFRATLNYGTQTVLAQPTGTSRIDAPLIFDIRAERRFPLPHGTTLSVFIDGFNLANSNAVVDLNTASGAAFLKPITILPPRVARFGVKASW